MSVRLPVGVIGVGALGRHHARHLAHSPEVDLVGVYDIRPERTAEVADLCRTVACTDLDQLLARARAVTIAVPTSAHGEVGLAALERGRPVLMEKPLAATLDEADALVDAAARRGVQLQVGHIERFNRALRAAEPYLAEPRFMESLRLAPFQVRGTDVAVVLDLMIHDLDLMLYLTGGAEPVEVRASGVAVLSPFIDMANARVEFADGTVATATASRMAKDRVRRLRIFQSTGYLSLDLATGAGEFMRLREGWTPGNGAGLEDVVETITLVAPEADALRLELHSFVHAIQGEREAVVSGEAGRAALRLALQVADEVGRAPIALTPPR